MKDIIQIEKDYPRIIRKAIGKIDGVSYVIILEYNKSWWVRLYKEECFVSIWKYSLGHVLFFWRFFANRYFSKLMVRHNFKEVNKNGNDM